MDKLLSGIATVAVGISFGAVMATGYWLWLLPVALLPLAFIKRGE
jgi:hypothetical protein